MTTPLLIGPYTIGTQQNLKPFMLPEEAFPDLFNAYVWRGRVERKRGFAALGRLRRVFPALTSAGNSPVVGGAGTVTINLLAGTAFSATEPNSELVPGNATVPLVITFAAPIGQTLTDTTGTGALVVGGAGPITSATISYSTWTLTVVFSGAVGAAAITLAGAYYPGLPCMGLRLRELPASDVIEETIAFDYKYAYRFNFGTRVWSELVTGTTWTPPASDDVTALFWTTNFYQVSGNTLFWVCNYNTTDPIRYYNGTAWTTITPTLNAAGDTLQNARILVAYQGRMVALNVIQNEGVFPAITTVYHRQRAVWSLQGNPTVAGTAWLQVPGGGGFLDAPTSEAIISAGFVKDQLVVYFERSTWQLVATGSDALPFYWQRINNQLGCDGTFSNVTFDNGLLAFGNVGIHTTDGVSVNRIDTLIPSFIYSLKLVDAGTDRSYGIRDYFKEFVYWAYPDADQNPFFPNRVLAYNYRDGSWSQLEDSFTCFGYFSDTDVLPWSGLPFSSWSAWTSPWNAFQTGELTVAAGNQQGFTFLLSREDVEEDPTFSIRSISNISSTTANLRIYSYENNLQNGDLIEITGCIGYTDLNYNVSSTIYQVVSIIDESTFDINKIGASASIYRGGGLIRKIKTPLIATKMFNPFWNMASRYRLVRIEYLFDRTDEGSVTGNVYTSMNTSLSMTDPDICESLLGSNQIQTSANAIYPFQQFQDQIWQRQYTSLEGDTFQVVISMSKEQLIDPTIQQSEIILHGMVLHFEKSGGFR